MKPIIVFPLLTWDSELIHRDQMLAKEFAKAGNGTYFLDRVTREPWNIFGTRRSRVVDGVNVITVFVLPYLRGRVPLVYAINDFLIGRQLANFYRRLGSPRTLYISNPDWANHVSQIAGEEDSVVYDISDDYSALAKNEDWSKIVAEHDRLAKVIANKYIATSPLLLSGTDKAKSSAVITNGVDLEGFEGVKPLIGRGEYRKVAGFIGGIYEWVDLGLIGKAAKTYKDVLFVLVGPTDRGIEMAALTEMNPNVRYLGAKPKEQIGGYFASFDVGLVPFASEKSYPRLATVDSSKIYQYLYFGYPVVATDFAQARAMSSLVALSGSAEDFITNLGVALEATKDEKRREFAAQNSWKIKAEEILDFIND